MQTILPPLICWFVSILISWFSACRITHTHTHTHTQAHYVFCVFSVSLQRLQEDQENLRRRNDELMNLYTTTVREEFTDLGSDIVDVSNQVRELKTSTEGNREDIKVSNIQSSCPTRSGSWRLPQRETGRTSRSVTISHHVQPGQRDEDFHRGKQGGHQGQ